MKEITKKEFTNGVVYLLKTDDGYPIETTDTFLPINTKNAIGRNTNCMETYDIGTRDDRWMIGVSVQSSCPVKCKFCATAKLKKWRNLTAEEIYGQVLFVLKQNYCRRPQTSKEFKINYTRMGDFSFNKMEVQRAISMINICYPDTHHFVSTIGIKGDDYSWIKDNITLQISLHSLNEEYRNWLIPYNKKMTIEELGQIRTKSNLKTTLNLTLTDEEILDVDKLKKYFDPKYFFIKLSPLNENIISVKNKIKGVVLEKNLV